MTDRDLAAQADAAFRKTTSTYKTWKKNVDLGKYPALGGPSQFGIGFGLLAQIDPQSQPLKFGFDLPARNLAPQTSPVGVTTLAQLRSTLAVCGQGTIVKLIAPLDLGGQDLVLNRQASAVGPITVDLAAPVSNGRILISRAAYLNLRFTDLGHSTIDGIKLTDGSHHIDIDGRGGRIHDTARQGFLQTDAACHDWQFWNARMDNCGSAANANLDHANYVHDARGECVMGNLIVTAPRNYGYQFYSDCRDLIATGCESHGTRNGRGGYVIGNEAGLTTSNVRVFGPIVTGANQAMEEFNTAKDCRVYDGIEWKNSGGFDPAFQPTHCVNADPSTKAKGFVLAAQHGFHATHDIDGKPFVTADAGARAL